MLATDWRVMRIEYFGKSHWQVYRLKETGSKDEIGNREFALGVFESYEDAKRCADQMNDEEVSR